MKILGYELITPCELMQRARREKDIKQPQSRFPELQDAHYYASPQYQIDIEKAQWPLADLELLEFTRKLFGALRRANIPSYVHTCYRTPSLQAALQLRGNSQIADGPHQRSAAVDIVHSYYHWNAPSSYWDFVGTTGKEIIRANNYKIEWGGDWSFYDPAHWQSKDWRKKPRISDQAILDRDTGEVINWYRSPFSKSIAAPTLSDGESYYSYLLKEGREWKTAKPNNKD